MDRSEESGHSLEFVQRTEVFDRNENNRTALYQAVVDRKPVAYLQKLIDELADESARCDDGITPLMRLMYDNYLQRDTFFFLSGTRNAPLDVGDNNGETPLMTLIFVGYDMEFLEQLLKNGANPFIKNKHGQTAREKYQQGGSRKVQDIIHRLKTVEDGLLEEINHERLTAVMRGVQQRISAGSPLSILDEDTIRMIVGDFTEFSITSDDIGKMKNGEARDYVKATMIKLQT